MRWRFIKKLVVSFVCFALSFSFVGVGNVNVYASNYSENVASPYAIHGIPTTFKDMSTENNILVSVTVTNATVQVPPFCFKAIDWTIEYQLLLSNRVPFSSIKERSGSFTPTLASREEKFSFPYLNEGIFRYRVIANFHGDVQYGTWHEYEVGVLHSSMS